MCLFLQAMFNVFWSQKTVHINTDCIIKSDALLLEVSFRILGPYPQYPKIIITERKEAKAT
jgi:hypothetical protein